MIRFTQEYDLKNLCENEVLCLPDTVRQGSVGSLIFN
jgi:hypothetical protein